jgi:hypothetical protein
MHIPDDFYSLCDVRLHDGQLTISCCLGDRCWERTVDVAPLVQVIHEALTTYHARLHGVSAEQISGWGWAKNIYSKAKRVATTVAKNKAVKSLWKDVSPYLRDELLGKIPGGAAAYRTALKVSRAVEKAREGNPQAVAAIKALAAKAETSSKAAKDLQVARTVNYMLATKESKEAPKVATGAFAASPQAPKRKAKVKAKRIKRTESWANRPTQATSRPLPPRVRAVQPPTPPPQAVQPPTPPPQAVQPQAVQPQEQYEEPYYEEPYYEEPYEEPYPYYDESDVSVDGWREWFFSSPYRSPLGSVVDASPGVGFAARKLYRGGLDILTAK